MSQIGKMLARLRYATEGFTHEAEDRYYGWDVQHLLTLEHLLDEVDDDKQRHALSQGLADGVLPHGGIITDH